MSKLLSELRSCEGGEEGPLAQDHTAPGSWPGSTSPGAHQEELHLRGFSESKCAQDEKILSPEVPVETQHGRGQGRAKEKQYQGQKAGFQKDLRVASECQVMARRYPENVTRKIKGAEAGGFAQGHMKGQQ